MDTRAIGIRVPDSQIEKVNRRALKKGVSFNKWVNWAITQGLRSHKKKGGASQEIS